MNDYKPLERQRLEELYRKQNVRINELEQENKKLKESLDIATKCSSKEEDGIIRLSEENILLKNELAWLKDHTKYNYLNDELYIDGTMTATEAMLRLQQAEANQQQVMQLTQDLYVLKHTVIAGKTVEEWIKESNTVPEDAMIKEEENNKLKEEIRFLEECLDNKEKVNKSMREEIKNLKEERDNWEKTATKFTKCIDTLESSIKNLEEENKSLREDLKIWKLTAKDYARQCGVDLDNDLNI